MAEIYRINMRAATTDPEATFSRPSEVAEHLGLTRGQKIATLEKWQFAVRSRVDSVSEGMTNYPEGAYTRDVDLLRDLEKAIEALVHPPPPTAASP